MRNHPIASNSFSVIPYVALLAVVGSSGCSSSGEVDRSGDSTTAIAAITIEPQSTMLHDWVHGKWTMALTASSSAGSVVHFGCALGPNLLIDLDSSNERVKIELNTSTLSDGSYTLECGANDTAGNSRSWKHQVQLDNTPPKLAWFANGAAVGELDFVGGTVELRINVDERAPLQSAALTSAVASLTPYLKGRLNSASFTATLPTDLVFGSGLSQLPLTFAITDQAGNQTVETLTLQVDNRGPRLLPITPAANQMVHDTVPIQVVAESNLAIIEFSAALITSQGTTRIEDTDLSPIDFSSSLATAAFADQYARLVYSATDSALKTATLEIPIGINNVVFDQSTKLNLGHRNYGDFAVDYANDYLVVGDFDNQDGPDLAFGQRSKAEGYAILQPLGAQTVTGNWFDHLSTFAWDLPNLPFGHRRNLVACDFNRDGKLDISYANFTVQHFPWTITSVEFKTLHGPVNNNGSFPTTSNLTDVGQELKSYSCGDLNRDGYPEHLYGSWVFFSRPTYHELYLNDLDIINPVGDLDNDGYDDLAVLGSDSGNLQFVYGPTTPSGRGPISPVYARNTGVSNNLAIVQGVGDLNLDGYDDVLIPEMVGGQPSPEHNAVRILWGQKSRTTVMRSTILQHPLQRKFMKHTGRGLNAGDFDGDGHRDLAIYASNSDNRLQVITVMYGPNFTRFQDIGMPTAITGADRVVGSVVEVADFNQDGRDDLAIEVQSAYSSGEGELLIYSDNLP